MLLPKSVTLCEVGLRDGLQNEKTILSTDEKLTLLRGCEAHSTVIFPQVDEDGYRKLGIRLTCEVNAREMLPYLGDAVPGFFNPAVELKFLLVQNFSNI